VLIPLELTMDERRWVRQGWLERIVRVDWWDVNGVKPSPFHLERSRRQRVQQQPARTKPPEAAAFA
jgi:hypothetical protein